MFLYKRTRNNIPCQQSSLNLCHIAVTLKMTLMTFALTKEYFQSPWMEITIEIFWGENMNLHDRKRQNVCVANPDCRVVRRSTAQ